MLKLRLQRPYTYYQCFFCLVLFSLFLIPTAKAVNTSIIQITGDTSSIHMGDNRGLYIHAASFVFKPPISTLICQINLHIKKSNSPTDLIYLDIYSYNNVKPVNLQSGSLITRLSVNGSTLPTTGNPPSYTTFNLDNCFLASRFSYYGVVVSRQTIAANGYDVSVRTTNQFDYTYLFQKDSYDSWSETASQELGVQILGDTDLAGAGIPEPTYASASMGCAFGDISCEITSGLQTAFTWLFIPASGSFNQFVNLWDTIKTKPPIGYFTAVQSAFSTLSVASGSYYLTFSGLDSGNSPLKTLKTGLIWVLWVMLAFWILHRIRQMEI